MFTYLQVYQMTGVQSSQNAWATYTHNGAWIANETAGGCRNYIRMHVLPSDFHFFFLFFVNTSWASLIYCSSVSMVRSLR